MDITHIRWLEESLERNAVLKAENGRIGPEKTKRA
jgi:hypothetical protein